MKKNQYEAYERFDNDEDFKGLAKQVIEQASMENRLIEKDERRVEKALKSDLHQNMPPQILALIGAIATAVEKAEKDQAG